MREGKLSAGRDRGRAWIGMRDGDTKVGEEKKKGGKKEGKEGRRNGGREP